MCRSWSWEGPAAVFMADRLRPTERAGQKANEYLLPSFNGEIIFTLSSTLVSEELVHAIMGDSVTLRIVGGATDMPTFECSGVPDSTLTMQHLRCPTRHEVSRCTFNIAAITVKRTSFEIFDSVAGREGRKSPAVCRVAHQSSCRPSPISASELLRLRWTLAGSIETRRTRNICRCTMMNGIPRHNI